MKNKIVKIKKTDLSTTAARRWQKSILRKNDNPDLEIVIVNYNGSFWLKKTLETLAKNYLKETQYKVKVTVVDNNSNDDSREFLAHQSIADVILVDENLGFAKANNLVIEKSQADKIMLLNSDIEFLNWPQSNLDILINYLNNHKNVGMIGPFLKLSNDNLDPASHRGEPTPWAAITYFLGLEKMFPKLKFTSGYHQYYLDLKKIHEVDAISGAAMMVKKSAILKVGLLDERFFMYAEDLDWARRFREAGYKIIFNPEVILIHHKNKSGLENKNALISKKTNKYFWETMLQYYDKYYPNNKLMRWGLQGLIFLKKDGF